jgi:hypothetical protein
LLASPNTTINDLLEQDKEIKQMLFGFRRDRPEFAKQFAEAFHFYQLGLWFEASAALFRI